VTRSSEPLFELDLGELRQVRPRDLAVRFAFGAVISVVAGVVGQAAGSRAGGALLAFPAILPATLTLIEKEDGTAAAVADVRGSVLGALALVAFALVAFVSLGRLPPPASLAAALGAWIVVALGLYVIRARRSRS